MDTVNQVGVGLSGSTGTGTFVGAISPTLVTPRAAQINDANGNPMFALNSVGAADYWQFSNAGALGSVQASAFGSDTNIDMVLFPKGQGQFKISTGALTQPIVINSGTSGQHVATFNFANTAGTNNFTFPDASGTLVLESSAITTIKTFVYTSNATYTPSAGTVGVLIEMCGAGGGGGGCSNGKVGASGGAGGYIKQYLTAAEVGASLALVVPAGGGGGGTDATGTTGSATTVSTPSNAIVLTANGGNGGAGGGTLYISGATGGTSSVSTGSVTYTGLYLQGGGSTAAVTIVNECIGSQPGHNALGNTTRSVSGGGFTNDSGLGYGSGGGGACSNASGGNRSGGTGTSGVVFITEYS